MISKKFSIKDSISIVKHELQSELNKHNLVTIEPEEIMSLPVSSDSPTKYRTSDVHQLDNNHYRCNLGGGFGLDLVLLDSRSLAFRSFAGGFLPLKNDTKWPGSLFNPVVGEA